MAQQSRMRRNADSLEGIAIRTTAVRRCADRSAIERRPTRSTRGPRRAKELRRLAHRRGTNVARELPDLRFLARRITGRRTAPLVRSTVDPCRLWNRGRMIGTARPVATTGMVWERRSFLRTSNVPGLRPDAGHRGRLVQEVVTARGMRRLDVNDCRRRHGQDEAGGGMQEPVMVTNAHRACRRKLLHGLINYRVAPRGLASPFDAD
jgi:hypothetical protein